MSTLLQELEQDPDKARTLSTEQKDKMRLAMSKKIANEVLKGIQLREKQERDASKNQPAWYERFFCLDPQNYKEHFDVTTEVFWSRCKEALMFWRGGIDQTGVPSGQGENKNYDLYGPIWISATLAFLLIFTGNLHKNLYLDSSTYSLDSVIVSIAFTAVLVFFFIWPALLYLLGKCFGVKTTVYEQICIYGYSGIIYLPFLVVCVIPNATVVVLFLVVASIIHSIYTLRNHANLSSTQDSSRKFIVYALIFCMEVAFFCTIFFGIYNSAPSQPATTPAPTAPLTQTALQLKHHFRLIHKL